jgi:hypothetical protein
VPCAIPAKSDANRSADGGTAVAAAGSVFLPVSEADRRRPRAAAALLLLVATLAAVGPSVAAQIVPSNPEPQGAGTVGEANVQAGPPAMFTYADRPIVELRASILGRPPAERVATAQAELERLVEAGGTGPVESRPVGDLIAITVGGRGILVIAPADVDTLAGETHAGTAALAVSRLQTALDEVNELNRPRPPLMRGLLVGVVTVALVTIVWAMMRLRRTARDWMRPRDDVK